MKILIDMGHPAHVHLFKNFINEMEGRGHEIKITARDKEVTKYLLAKLGIQFTLVGQKVNPMKNNLWREWVIRDYEILKIARRFNPDCLIGVLNPAISHSAAILKKRSIIFTDTEHAKFANRVTLPFASDILTPSCYEMDLGQKQFRYEGYHELAYLHPDYFDPDPSVFESLNLDKDDKLIILRLVSWNASHDHGQYGIKDIYEFIEKLDIFGRVVLTSEKPLNKKLKKYQINIPPEKFHDLLYYASLYIGEGATIASEAAMLGTHAIYINSLKLGYLNEEGCKYNLVYSFTEKNRMQDGALSKAIELLSVENLKKEGLIKKGKLLNDKINVTKFMIHYIENEIEGDNYEKIDR